MPEISIGGRAIALDEAEAVLARYTSSDNVTSNRPFAYPAYDTLDTGSSANELNDGDLLAPQLLNVQIKLTTYYSLKTMRERLESGLAAAALARPLTEQTDEEVAGSVSVLYEVLDHEDVRGLRGTTLSKVLHRKRPEALVLHDRNVRTCYLGDGRNQVPKVKSRTWSDYMVQLSQAVRRDLVSQLEAFDELSRGLRPDVRLSHVRILDILAWHVGGRKQPEV